MELRSSPRVLWGLFLALMSQFPINADACRPLPTPPGLENTFWVHVEGPCLPGEQELLAVKGTDLFHAVQQGNNIDLQNVLVVGDVMLDLLPLHDVAENSAIPAAVREHLENRQVAAVRIIPGSFSIRHSRFEKVLATNLEDGALLMLKAVDFTGTIFHRSVDFSKTVFVAPVSFSNVRVEFEGFFIGAHFEHAVDFSQMTFGIHSRFHKADFRDRVTFADTRFAGVAEFLEVQFQERADFSRSHFASGTGFSGSVFAGPADFSHITVDHEIYFRFTEFKHTVSFQDAEFHNVVDFSNARFDGGQNFTGVEFKKPPQLTGSNVSPGAVLDQEWWRQQSQFWIFAGLVILVLFCIWMSRAKK